MFLGHFAVALAAKKAAPKTSLGTLFIGAQFIDLLWPILLVAGVEHVRLDPGNTVVTPLDFYNYPFSHSLTGVVIWSVVVGGVYFAFRRYRRGALVLGAAVLSHWVLDLLTHRPDLPLTFSGDARAGFGLWNSLPFTLIVELGLFAAGVVFYLRATSANGQGGELRFVGADPCPGRDLCDEPLRSSAAERGNDRNSRECGLAVRALGVLGGPSPECGFRSADLFTCPYLIPIPSNRIIMHFDPDIRTL